MSNGESAKSVEDASVSGAVGTDTSPQDSKSSSSVTAETLRAAAFSIQFGINQCSIVDCLRCAASRSHVPLLKGAADLIASLTHERQEAETFWRTRDAHANACISARNEQLSALAVQCETAEQEIATLRQQLADERLHTVASTNTIQELQRQRAERDAQIVTLTAQLVQSERDLQKHVEALREERDAMQRRAEAAEADWQGVIGEVLQAIKDTPIDRTAFAALSHLEGRVVAMKATT